MDNVELEFYIKKLKKFYEIKVIGESVLGRNIYAFNKQYNENFKWALVSGGIHAREHISTDLIVLFMKKLTHLEEQKFNISFVPLLNPDGADLVINGLKNVSYFEKNLKLIQEEMFL